MPDDPKTLTWYSKTNKRENSCTPVTCGCPLWFELHQQTAIKLLSNHTKDDKYKLEPSYEARAKRIAAIYAHLFLETLVLDDKAHPNPPIKFGNTNLRGRFYWMGLGAFASKTMAMVFGAIRSIGGFNFDVEKSRSAINILAKGNLWLAMDIVPWHLAWAQDKEGFKKCMNSRDFKEFKNLKPAIDSLPWSGSVPKTLRFKDKDGVFRQLGATTEIENAFNTHLKEIEKIFNDPKNITEHKKFTAAAKPLLAHLMQIAVQEQQNILQKICWDEPDLQQNVLYQRHGKIRLIITIKVSDITIDTTLGLSSDYDVDKLKRRRKNEDDVKKLKEDPWSTPPEGTIVENYNSRMVWIERAAKKYHRLMQDGAGRAFLKKELGVIASWVNDTTGIARFFIHEQSNDGKR
ncbi:DUF2515 family protein [Moraxella bovis]|uniref:DUF2515 family protein n=1 Tax=Moraxella bovis TaxID=476 RepID=UPI002226EDA7|nr:hypothetical protein [Moraxella bovis]UYZ81556.1 hypothetical protein LP113_02055 [Moraxella bovis]